MGNPVSQAEAVGIGVATLVIFAGLKFFFAPLRKFVEQLRSRPPGGEVNAERDLEMGTMNGGQGINHPGVADYEDAHREGNDLEMSEEDMAVLGHRSNQQGAHVPAIKESMVQLETMAQATEAETERASRVSVVADVAHTQQDEVLIEKMINEAAVLLEGVEVGHE